MKFKYLLLLLAALLLSAGHSAQAAPGEESEGVAKGEGGIESQVLDRIEARIRNEIIHALETSPAWIRIRKGDDKSRRLVMENLETLKMYDLDAVRKALVVYSQTVSKRSLGTENLPELKSPWELENGSKTTSIPVAKGNSTRGFWDLEKDIELSRIFVLNRYLFAVPEQIPADSPRFSIFFIPQDRASTIYGMWPFSYDNQGQLQLTGVYQVDVYSGPPYPYNPLAEFDYFRKTYGHRW